MSYRRSLSIRVGLLRQRFNPSFTYILHDDDDKCQPSAADISRPQNRSFLQRGYHNSSMNSASAGIDSLFRRNGYSSLPLGLGCLSCNYSSNAIGEEADKIEEYLNGVTEIISEKSVEVVSQVPAASEVAIAAADSYFPVAALQYIIDGVHSFTGLNWWASIVLTTFMIRGCTVPLLINQLKASSKLAKMRPELEEIKDQMQNMASDPKAVAEGQQRMSALFKQHGVTPFTPLKGILISGPIFVSFFLAISNMAEKVPSFKQGGAFWFTDLTTPDALYVFPILTALSFLITVEFNMQEGMEGNPMARTMKTFSRILGVLTVPFTMSFPKVYSSNNFLYPARKYYMLLRAQYATDFSLLIANFTAYYFSIHILAIFCYWITSNIFSLMYGIVIKRPDVKKFLNLPAFPVTSTPAPKPAFSVLSALKMSNPAAEGPASLNTENSKRSDGKISSSSVISQRLRTLEKQVKGRKKNKKR
ncbi:hypothetical protein IFM89_008616 [Coptis chinensis]|uniref:Membrane insertase YidC/Oxa/ALB C-terminal domain-containing protein n=1 Tax=Coptis chinensis TaxID=261450 RepID=A0A835HK15_9MAGN|nr:hypothetical protein IFM89_008616 [Coptis chinensis]